MGKIKMLDENNNFQHLSKTRIYNFYSSMSDYKKTLMYTDMKAIEESSGLREGQKTAEEECLFRIEHFNDIKENGLKNPVDVYKLDDKYIIADGGGRASACLFLGIPIKVRVITQYIGDINHYVNINEVEVQE